MGGKQQGSHQREQQVGDSPRPVTSTIRRTSGEWDILVCKVMLVAPEYLEYLKSFPTANLWQIKEVRLVSREVMDMVGATGTCEASTFAQAMRSGMNRLNRQYRMINREQRDRTERRTGQ